MACHNSKVTTFLNLSNPYGKIKSNCICRSSKNHVLLVFGLDFKKEDDFLLILNKSMSKNELCKLAHEYFGDMVKGVVDIDREIIVLNAELHADLEAVLLEQGSTQNSLWGFNLYPELDDEDFLEFDSLINIRPMQGNRSRNVENEDIQRKIKDLVKKWIKE